MNRLSLQAGATLLEMVLVLVIMAAVMVMGIRAYQSYRADIYYRELQANVDGLFQGAQNYYYAQCGRQWDPSTGPIAPPATPPSLDPQAGASTSEPIPVSLTRLTPYLPSNLLVNGALPPNPIVNESNANKYIVQFNPVVLNRSVQTSIPGSSGADPTVGSSKVIGSIVVWQIQVSVRVLDITQVDTYVRYLGATCASRFQGAKGYVSPCANLGSATKQYIAWNRLPTFANSLSGASDYWSSNLRMNQFKQMYTTYPINYLTSDGSHDFASDQYFLCGN